MLRHSPYSKRPLFTQLMLGCLMVFSLNSAVAQNNDAQKKKFEELRRSIEQLKQELQKTRNSRDNLQENLESNERQIQKLRQKTQKLLDKIKQKQSHLHNLHNEQKDLSQKKSEQRELVSDYINAAHRFGQHSRLKLLLNQQDPAQAARILKYYATFSKSRSEKIQEFVSLINRIQEIEPEITAETQRLQASHATLKTQEQALQHKHKQRGEILAGLEKQINSQKQRLSALEQDRQRLEQLLSRVYEEINAQELALDISDFRNLKGRLPWPTKGKALNRFGSKRAGSELTWQGIQIQAQRGTDVIAVHHGQVVFSDYLRGHGLLLIIDHGAGFMSLYAHSDQLYKELGEWVEAGENIASVGSTGGRRDTALYFELRYKGKPTNPKTWFRPA